MAGKPGTNKCNDAIFQERIGIMLEFLYAAMRRSDIYKYICKKDKEEIAYKEQCMKDNVEYIVQWNVWNITIGAMDAYIRHAKKEIDNFYAKNRETILNISISRLDNIYKKAYGTKDYRLAKDIIKDIVSISGVEAARKVDLNISKESNLDNLTFEEAYKLMYNKDYIAPE